MKKLFYSLLVLVVSKNLIAQNVGIGTTTPIGKLDVVGAGTTSSTNTFLLRNSIGDTLFRMRDDGRIGIGYNGSSYGRTLNLGGSGVNFYTSNEAAYGGSIFPTDTSLVIWSNSGSNNYLVFQPSWGNTGIGTYTPNAKLHLNGAMLIGSNSDVVTPGTLFTVKGNADVEDRLTSSAFSMTSGAFNGAFLQSDATGNASWVSPSLIETDPQVQSATNNRVPKWNGTALVDGLIQDNGLNIVLTSGAEYTYSAVKNRVLHIPASSFRLVPLQGTSSGGLTSVLSNNNGGGLYIDNGAAGTDAFFEAPIILPVGAIINGIDLYVRDQNNTAEVSGDLVEADLAGFTQTVIASTTATGVATTPGNTTISNSLLALSVVSGRAYFIRFNTKENSNGLRIFGARVNYSVSRAE
jgi:hypothetical protein